MLDTLKLAIVDVETTGPSAAFDRIIEIGIQRVEAGSVVETFSTVLDPGCRIPDFIQQLTGITNEEVDGAPTFGAIHRQVRALLEGCVFVAHNARFDYGFLRNEFARVQESFSAPCLCTVRLSRLLYPRHRHHDLSSLIQRFGFACARRHRALDDAAVLWEFLRHAHQAVPPSRFSAALTSLLRRPTLPPQLKPDAVDSLPSGPGVYVLHDATGMPLYVGKSVDIRERVLSHFAGDYRSGREMQLCQQTARITTYPTYGELGALLLESRLIKQLAPLHNRLSRARTTLWVACQGPSRRGYATVRLTQLASLPVARPERILGVFRSRPQAKTVLHELARAHRLCPRLLGLERSTRGPCLASQLALCDGACAGREPAPAYNARLAAAFVERRIKPWPYAGPIAIDEPAPDQSQGHAFIVDRWRLVHAASYSGEDRTVLISPQDGFDYDEYQLLRGYLMKRPRRVTRLTAAEARRLLASLVPA